MSAQPTSGKLPGFVAAVAGLSWALGTAAAARAGVFTNWGGVGPLSAIQVAILAPVLVCLAVYRVSRSFRAWVHGLDYHFLAGIQFFRILGASHLVSWGAGIMAGSFALPVGIGNLFVSLLAVLTLHKVVTGDPHWRKWLTGLSVVGIFEFGMTIALAVFGLFAQATPLDPPMSPAGYMDFRLLPLSVFPSFLIPLFLVIHVVTLLRLFGTPPSGPAPS